MMHVGMADGTSRRARAAFWTVVVAEAAWLAALACMAWMGSMSATPVP
jgi:hypothetical protein